MPLDLGTAVGYLLLDTTSFTKGFSGAMKDLETFNDKTATSMDKFASVGSAMTSVGGTLTKGVTLPIVAIGAAAVSVGNSFEKQMSRVKAISGATTEDFKDMEDQAVDLGAKTSFSALEAAQGMEDLASAGLSAKETMAAMPGTLDLAASSGTDVATAASYAASALNAFGMIGENTAQNAKHVADVYAEASARTKAQTEDMGEAMKYIAPVANAMGISFEETAASIGLMSNAGIEGSQAGTTLRGALSRLAKPTDDMTATMQKYGLSFYDANGKMVSLTDMTGQLSSKLGGLTQQQRDNALVTLFGQESLSGILALMDAGPDKLAAMTTSFKNCDGAASDMAKTMQDNTSSSIEQMFGSLQSAAIMIQKLVAPAVKQVADAVSSAVQKLLDMDPAVQKIVVAGAAIAAAAGPLLIFVGNIIRSISAISGVGAAIAGLFAEGGALAGVGAAIAAIGAGPIALVVAAIAGLVIAWKTDFAGIREVTASVWASIKSIFTSVVGYIKTVVTAVIGIVRAVWDNDFLLIRSRLETFWAFFKTGWEVQLNTIKGVFQAISQVLQGDFSGAIDTLKNMFSKNFQLIGNLFSNLGNSIKQKLSDAGAAISGWVESVGTWFSQLPSKIAYGLGYALGTLAKWVVNMGNSIRTGVPALIESIGQFFSSLPSRIGAAFTNALKTFVSWFTNMKTAAPAKVEEVKTAVVTGFTTLPGKILEIGKNVVDGLWNGITGGLSTLISNVKGFCTQVIDGFKKGFDTHSPSKKTIQIGQWVVDGLRVGMKDSEGNVIKTVDQLASTLITRFEAIKNNISTVSDLASAKYKLWTYTSGKGEDSVEGLDEKITMLTKQEKLQAQQVASTQKEYDDMVKIYGATSSKSQQLLLDLYNEKIAYEELRQAVKDANAAKTEALNESTGTAVESATSSAKGAAILAASKYYGSASKAAEVVNSGNYSVTSSNTYVFNSPKAIDEVSATKLMQKAAVAVASGTAVAAATGSISATIKAVASAVSTTKK